MRRHILGILATASFLGAIALWLWPAGGYSPLLEATAWRMGALLAVWWLAYPDFRRLSGWLLVALPVALVIVLVRPKLVILAIPVLIVLALLKPRLGRR